MTNPLEELSAIAEAYVKVRAQRSDLKKQFTDADQPLKDMQDQLENQALLRMDAGGMQNIKTKAGPTCYISETPKFSVGDRDVLEAYILANPDKGAIDIFGNTLSKPAVKAHLEETGQLPPGVKQFVERHARFRSK